MKKIIAITMIFTVLFSGFALVQAKQDQSKKIENVEEEYTIPERNGVYAVPGHPELKVKVFVHKAKKKKPTPPPSESEIVCGLSDDNTSDEFVDTTGWKLPIDWTYSLNLASVPSSVGSENLRTIVNRAFGVWSDTSGVNFWESSTTTANRARQDGQNIIAWGRASGRALAVTYTWYYTRTGEVVETDTIMNLKFSWDWTDQIEDFNCANANSYDAQNILTHELGHWMGLADYYTDIYANHTMYGYGSKGEVKKNTLTEGDKNGIYNIYNSAP